VGTYYTDERFAHSVWTLGPYTDHSGLGKLPDECISESRIWEIRPFGSMRGGSELVIGLLRLSIQAAPAYSTKKSFCTRADP